MMSQKSRADNISSWREQLTILNVADSLSEIRPNLWLISQAQRRLVTLLGTFRWSFGIESRHDEARKGEARTAILLWKVCLGESGDAESASRKLWYGGFTLLEWRTPQYTLGWGLSRRDARRGCCRRGNTAGVGNPGRSRTEKKILTAGGCSYCNYRDEENVLQRKTVHSWWGRGESVTTCEPTFWVEKSNSGC